MGYIDVSKVEYDVELVTEKKERYRLNNALISLQWEEQKGELAQRATLTLANIPTDGKKKRIANIVKINCKLFIYGRWGQTAPEKSAPGENWPTIRKGAKNPAVSEMQKMLLENGHKLPKFGVDGYWWEETDSAVRAFRKKKGLSAESVCGPKMWAALEGKKKEGKDGDKAKKKTNSLLFEGIIWEWQYSSDTQKEVNVTAYDPMIRLQQSKDFRYYSKGKSTQEIIGDICTEWGVPLAYKWGESKKHGKKVFNAEPISEMIIELLEKVRQKKGKKYAAYYRNHRLEIVGYGSNSTVYRFDNSNTLSTSDSLNINNLVTVVKIIGKEDKKGRAPVDAMVKGDMRFGPLQDIVRRDSDKSLGDAKDEAENILKEQGEPEEMIQVTAPDVPFLRKGDKVEMDAANLNGFFYVDGVTHDATARQMTLSLTRKNKQ